jgi:hypothetical protein
MEKNLPVFCELVPGQLFVVTYFRQEEIEIRSHDYQQKGIDIARNYILINDCSGTMGGGAPGSGSRWDGLEHVNYGVLKCLYRAGQLTQKEIDVWVAQFSNTTLLSGPFPLAPFYESPKGKGKETLLAYQGGNTILNPQIFPIIKKQLKPGRAVWSFVTDGDIYNADQVYPEIEKILKEPDQCVLFFEIFYKSSFGTKLRELSRRQKNLCYQSVDNIRQILDHSLEVLVQYEK